MRTALLEAALSYWHVPAPNPQTRPDHQITTRTRQRLRKGLTGSLHMRSMLRFIHYTITIVSKATGTAVLSQRVALSGH